MIEILFLLSLMYLGLYVYSLKFRNNSLVDLFWGIAFVIISVYSYLFESIFSVSQSILTLLVILWGFRLFFNILSKKWWKFHQEDYRYKAWRDTWEYVKIRSFFQVYLLQMLLAFIIAIPIFVLNFASGYEENLFLTGLWALIAGIWLLYETTADSQLAWFVAQKKKWQILTQWLRKLHRYPQYFWESLFWLGISIIASQIHIFAFLGWIVITLLVRYVSGVPLLEKRYSGDKKYEQYSQTTPIFIPDIRKLFVK